MRLLKLWAGLGLTAALMACGGGGGNPGNPLGAAGVTATTLATTTTTTLATAVANSTVSSISINPSATTLKADGTSVVTLTIYALTSGNAAVVGATVDLAATNGVILSAPSVLTTAAGVTVTMTSPSSDQTNRTATVTASCTGCTATPSTTPPIAVVGAGIVLTNSGSTSLVVGGSTATLTATVKDIAGVALPGVDVSFAATDPLVLGLSSAIVKTNGSGVAQVTVSAMAAGNTSVNVSALGNAQSQTFTAGVPAAVFAITAPANNSVLVTNAPQVIAVSTPAAATSVTFATTVGTFSNGLTSQNIVVVGGMASATLTSAQAGTATVTAIDNLSNSANVTLVVSPPVSAANKILLSASQTTVPLSVVGGTQNSLTLTARAIASNGSTDQAVANVPIQFSMTGGPGAGEFLSPALILTDSSGVAVATFTAGTTSSISNGISVTASIQGTTVKTGTAPSGNSVSLTVGAQALSVAFGPASVLGESVDKTLYVHAYSVQVTDANNNPVPGQVVTLRMRPVAFSVGTPCTVTATYCSEDVNGNGSLDAAEDGTRTATTETTTGACPVVPPPVSGTVDANLTPPNSDGGGIPATVTTKADGTAAFNLTYLKGSALWVINKLTATVSSIGTETSKSTIFRLAPTAADVAPLCVLPASPYAP